MAAGDRILFKLVEPMNIEVPGDAAALAAAAEEPLQQVLGAFGLPVPVPLLAELDRDEVQATVDEARAENMLEVAQVPNPLLCFAVDVDPSGFLSAEQLVELVRELPPVEWAQLDGTVTNAVRPLDNPAFPLQSHLQPAPAGIGPESAWALPGGDGSGVAVGFLEGFQMDGSHPDLPTALTVLRPGGPPTGPDSLTHATATMGVVAAADNTVDCVGIAPSSRVLLAGGPNANGSMSDSEAFVLEHVAGLSLGRGDVLNISMSAGQPAGGFPLDFLPAHRTASRLFDRRGTTVVQVAGNGIPTPQGQPCAGIDLDQALPAPLVPSNSPAIVVGGVQPGATPATFVRYQCSNFGGRVDCCAQAHDVLTLAGVLHDSQGNPVRRVDRMGGTSVAVPIVSGAIAAMQGIRKAQGRDPLTSSEIKAIFRDPTQTSDPAPGQRVGLMPDLAKIVPRL
ncbi:MAG TPA: S8 family serine peptidase [Conexibacter sp.]|nr:S8 family serine peptidase [Conexibacter sp.]